MQPHELIAIRTGMEAVEVRGLLDGRRSWNAPLELKTREAAERADDDAGERPDPGMRISGYSAVFDADSERLFGFLREQVKRGAFRKVLKRDPDVRLLINHEGAPFARTTNGTLELAEKPRGLFMEAELDDRRSDARDLYYATERGDFNQQSFAFTIARDEWRYCEHVEQDAYAGCDCEWERDILEIGDLYEASVVTFPAYPDTTAHVARESEPSAEQDTRASGDEPREQAIDTDTSQTHSVSDEGESIRIRSFIDAHRSNRNVYGTQGGAGPR